MSRLAGFNLYADGSAIQCITWKNYLEVDSFIVCFLRDNNAILKFSDVDGNLVISFDAKIFRRLYSTLELTLTPSYWAADDILMYDVKTACDHWDFILNNMVFVLNELEDEYQNAAITAEFFECS